MCFDCAGVVSTLAGSGDALFGDGVGAAAKFYWPFGVSVDSTGAVLVADFVNHRIRKVSSSGILIFQSFVCFVLCFGILETLVTVIYSWFLSLYFDLMLK